MEPTHASFFSGVGGLDLGLERAGWRTVSFSEIDPYASAVLAERWPGVPNLGDILRLAGERSGGLSGSHPDPERDADGWTDATLWSGGFPCQDLSVAGKRAGLAGARSGLAFAFLDLVERHRPPAILLENVPGLLSSHQGRDFAALLDRLGQLGYWWAYRILDAQFFGVPQRRRRVFIVALNAERGFGPDSAAAVLSVGARCGGHSAAGGEARTGVATGTGDSTVGTFTAGAHPGSYNGQDAYTGHLIANAVRAGGHGDPGIGRDGDEWRLTLSPSPDPSGNGTAHGLARRLDHRQDVEGEAIDAVLRRVWPTSPEEAIQRAARGLRGIPASEVLRHTLHGEELRQAAQHGQQPDSQDGELPRAEDGPAWAVLAMRQAEREGRASPQRGPERQPTGESDPLVPELSPETPHLAPTLRVGPARPQDGGPGDTVPITVAFDRYNGIESDLSPTLPSSFEGGFNHVYARTVQAPQVGMADGRTRSEAEFLHQVRESEALLPLGLDSHRYRCCGNGVVSNVAEWIGLRLLAAVQDRSDAA